MAPRKSFKGSMRTLYRSTGRARWSRGAREFTWRVFVELVVELVDLGAGAGEGFAAGGGNGVDAAAAAGDGA